MKAVLLAAGIGNRLSLFNRQTPKAIIKVASKPLVLRNIEFARKIYVEKIIVIGGYKSTHLWETLKNEAIIKIENPDFRKGNLYTLAVARDHLVDDFVIMNIDHLYPAHLARMIRKTSEGIWAISDFDRPLYQDDMKIRINGDPNLGAALASISKDLDKYDGGYCGMTVVCGDTCKDYLTAFDTVLNHGREQAVVEDVLAELIRVSKPPKVLDISGIRWLEIDTKEDLANAERILRMKPHFLD